VFEEWVAEVNETGLSYIAIGVGVVTVILGVTAMVTQGAPLQKPTAVSKVAMLVTPAALVCYSLVIGDPCLAYKLLTL
jgi:hypothetical protein